MTDTVLLDNKHYLVCIDVLTKDELLTEQLKYLESHFCGVVVTDPSQVQLANDTWVYVCGDVKKFLELFGVRLDRVKVVRDFSYGHDTCEVSFVSCAEVPIGVYGLGVFFRRLFADNRNYFEDLTAAHKFQPLTESNKIGSSYRTGIYLSEVRDASNGVEYNLLRCSTNFDGPTDNFRDVDIGIVDRVNLVAKDFFKHPAALNHVLAQAYENPSIDGKEKKARIKSHSDKTKDMPSNGLIAFCTFYSGHIDVVAGPSKTDPYDFVYKNSSVLTQLRFRLKKSVTDKTGLPEDFTVKLYPNSVFIIPLSTNRNYTHEILPPSLPVDKIPTRIGYVIRCSKTKAVHRDGNTYIKDGKLRYPSEQDRGELKELYFQENTTNSVVKYGDIFYSLNEGDYLQPSI